LWLAVNIIDGAAIRNDMAIKTPLFAEQVSEEQGTGASGQAVNGIVRAITAPTWPSRTGSFKVAVDTSRKNHAPWGRRRKRDVQVSGPLWTAEMFRAPSPSRGPRSSPCKPWMNANAESGREKRVFHRRFLACVPSSGSREEYWNVGVQNVRP